MFFHCRTANTEYIITGLRWFGTHVDNYVDKSDFKSKYFNCFIFKRFFAIFGLIKAVIF